MFISNETFYGVIASWFIIVYILNPLLGPTLTTLGNKFRDKIIGKKK
jgi:hypothetical protein